MQDDKVMTPRQSVFLHKECIFLSWYQFLTSVVLLIALKRLGFSHITNDRYDKTRILNFWICFGLHIVYIEWPNKLIKAIVSIYTPTSRESTHDGNNNAISCCSLFLSKGIPRDSWSGSVAFLMPSKVGKMLLKFSSLICISASSLAISSSRPPCCSANLQKPYWFCSNTS